MKTIPEFPPLVELSTLRPGQTFIHPTTDNPLSVWMVTDSGSVVRLADGATGAIGGGVMVCPQQFRVVPDSDPAD